MNLLLNIGITTLVLIDLNKYNYFIIDFNDSFTHNIYSIVKNLNMNPLVIHYQDNILLEKIIELNKKFVILFGPGPGNPSEYTERFSDYVKKIKSKNNIFLMGVCLGHQIIWSIDGLVVNQAKDIAHGRVKNYSIKENWKGYFNKNLDSINVQHYNSLAVKLSLSEVDHFLSNNWLLKMDSNELLMIANDRFLSMQFHPESVGTNFPELFFSPSRKFIYNIKDELPKDHRHLRHQVN